MRLHPLLAKAAAYSLTHSACSVGAVAISLLYIIVPFAVLHHQAHSAQLLGAHADAALPPSPAVTSNWRDPDSSYLDNERVIPPKEATSSEAPLDATTLEGIPLVGGILATALNAFLPFVAPRRSFVRIARMSIPVALWGAAWWLTLPGWNPGLSFLGSLLHTLLEIDARLPRSTLPDV